MGERSSCRGRRTFNVGAERVNRATWLDHSSPKKGSIDRRPQNEPRNFRGLNGRQWGKGQAGGRMVAEGGGGGRFQGAEHSGGWRGEGTFFRLGPGLVSS